MERSRFERLVRDHHAAVFRSARRILASDADAADAAQEVFLEVLRAPERFDAAREPGDVLRWMAARKALAQLRAARNRRRREDRSAMERERERDPEGQGLEALERGELSALVGELALKLPEELRHAVALRFGEGMTYAAIAEASECSEPTAHERVKRALERLRERLARAGHATSTGVLVASLERAEPATPVPRGLEARLLGLSAPSASVASLSVLVPIVSAVVLLGAGAAAMVSAVGEWRQRGAERALALAPAELEAASADVVRSAAPEPAAPARVSLEELVRGAPLELESGGDPTAPELETGRLAGRAVDAERRPLAGVRVAASSLARSGKLALHEREATTGADGGFALELPVGHDSGQEYVAVLRHEERVTHRTPPLTLRAGETLELGDLELLARSADPRGDWTLSAFVVDEAGAPVADALVTVQRRVHGERGAALERESSGRTDAAGRVELAGAHLGEKAVLVEAQAAGLRPGRFEHGVDRVGPAQRTFALERGLAIRGRVLGVAGAGTPAAVQVHTTGVDPSRWLTADTTPDGRFELGGLEEREYVVGFRAEGWSPAERTLAAGSEDVALELKRRDDARDVGAHMAELHGRVLDAATGEPVAVDVWGIDLVRLPAEALSLAPEALFARHRQGSMAQRAMLFEPPPPSDSFHAVGLDSGGYLAVARVAGYAPAFAGPFELAAGELRAGIELRLERGATLEGTLLDARGRPLAHGFAWLGAAGPDPRARLAELDAELRAEESRYLRNCARTDEAGRFRFEHLPPALPFATGALHREHAPALGPTLELREGEHRAGLELRLAPR